MSDPFFKFKCDIDGRFAAVRIYRGRVEWQTARVSSTARVLIVGLPAIVVLGVAAAIVATWVLHGIVHGVWGVVLGSAIGVIVGVVFGYRLGVLLGDVIFPTTRSEVRSVILDARTAISLRNASRTYSFISVRNGDQSGELRVAPGYADMLAGKLRSGRA